MTMMFEVAPMDREVVLDREWLSQALSTGRAHPVRVAHVELLDVIGWNCLTLRIKVTFEAPEPVDIPAQLCIKGLFGARHAAYTENGVLRAESLFYQEIVPATGMYAPRSFYTGADAETGSGVQILEDLNALGVVFRDGMYDFSVDQVRQTLEQLARLHGWSWDAPADLLPQIVSKLHIFASNPSVPVDALTQAMHDSRGTLLPDDMKSGQRIYAAVQALSDRGQRIEANFIHGDVHAGNVFDVNGRIGFYDFQIVQRGSWSLDVAYHLGSLLSTADRRAHEQDLIRYYLDRLAAHGGRPPRFETAWNQYREAVPYGFFLWAVTMRVDQPIIDANVGKLGLSVADHESFQRLGV